jgi:pimeloyl-ACP methyl ester carboxylesterase
MVAAERRIMAAGELGRPSAPVDEAQPPVLLVHGYGGSADSMRAIEQSLQRDGFRTRAITLPEHGFGDPMRDAGVVADAVRELLATTGAATIDLVGHSRGGVICRAWQQLLDEQRVTRRVVTVATINSDGLLHGVDRLVAAMPGVGIRQLDDLAVLIEQLRATRAGHDVFAIGTLGFDGSVHAGTSRIEQAPFMAVDRGRRLGPLTTIGHYRILRDDLAYETVRSALLTR